MLVHCNGDGKVIGSSILKNLVIPNQDIFVKDLELSLFPLPCSSFCHSVLFWYCQSANVCISLFIYIVAKAGAMG